MKQVRETAAGKSISAYVVLNASGAYVATVQAHYSDGGTCTVNVWDRNKPLQEARAGGGGYDKFTAALSGMYIDGHRLYDSSTSDIATGTIMAAYHDGTLSYEDARAELGALGAHFTNWMHATGRWESTYFIPGLDRLKALGYTVIKAI